MIRRLCAIRERSSFSIKVESKRLARRVQTVLTNIQEFPMKKMPQIAVCIVVLWVLLGWVDTIATASAQTASVEVTVDPAAEIGKAFAQLEPGAEAKALEEVVKSSMENLEQTGPSPMGIALISVMGIIGVFIAPVLMVIIIVWLGYLQRNQRERRNHETIRQMIEKGMEIPPNISFGDQTQPLEGAPILRRGLILIGVGLGLGCFFFTIGAEDIAGVGAIPLFIGLAYVLIWQLEKKKPAGAG
jgi:hypothetical protein